MLKKYGIASGLALFAALPAHAEFRWELGASYLTGDIDDNELDADIDVAGVNGSWYFSSVDTSKGPLSEAAFLDRASSIDINANDGEIDFDIDDIDVTSYGVGTRYVLNKESGWLIDASYEYSEVDDFETDSFTIGGGKYILEETLLTIAYTYSDPDLGDEVDTFSARLEHHMEMPVGSLKLEADYAYADPGDDSDTDTYAGAVIYYPTNKLGFGGSWERVVTGSSLDNWSVFARWFFMENAAVSVIYQDFEVTADIPNVDVDGDAILANALIRF